MKKCSACNIEKEFSEFTKIKTNKDGYCGQCKPCKAEKSREWVKNNPEKRKASIKKYDSKGYWIKNREKEIERNKQWKKDNKEKVYENTRKWREDNPKKVKEHKKRSYQNNKEKCNERTIEYLKKHPEKRKEYQAKTIKKESYLEWRRAYEKERQVHLTLKGKARKAVFLAILRGDLVRPTQCSRCDNTGRIEGHHPDYNKPLEVIWLCKKCHIAEHKILTNA